MTKLFVSYASHDSKAVDAIVADLRAAGQEFDVWFDKHSIPPGSNWWHAILKGIRNCDVFLFMISERSVQSPYSRLEIKYASDINRPIFPLMLPGAWVAANKPNLAFDSKLLPEGLDGDIQRVPYQGTANLISALSAAIEIYDPDLYRDRSESVIPPVRPNEADPREMYIKVETALFDTCPPDVSAAESELHSLFKNHADFRDLADAWISILNSYKQLTHLDLGERNPLEVKLRQRFSVYQAEYPPDLRFYDPRGYGSRFL